MTGNEAHSLSIASRPHTAEGREPQIHAALLDSHLLILSKLWDCHLFGDQRGYNCPLCLSFPERGWVRTRSPSPSGRAEWERFIARPTRAWGVALPSRYCRATGAKLGAEAAVREGGQDCRRSES